MRYLIYILLITMLGVVWLNNSTEGRKIKRQMDAVGQSNAAQYRAD